MKDLWDIIVKNKYVILFVSIVVILYAVGIFEYIFKFLMLVVLVAVAVLAGKKVQENEEQINKFINKGFKRNSDDNVYYYESKSNKKE